MWRLWGVAIAVLAAITATAQPGRPNVILILADDLGYGDLGSYGAPDIRTPNLDRLARDGVRLTQFYANAAVCTPTRAALITGRYQQRVLLERPLDTKPGGGLDQGLPATGRSLPQLLQNAGYATGLIGKWHLGFRAEFHPNRHGFEYFWGYLAGYVDWYQHVRGDGQADLWENATPVRHHGYLGHEITDRAVTFVNGHADRPFFLEVSYGAPHWPFQSPSSPSTARRTNDSMLQSPADPDPPTRRDYAAIVEDLDEGIGKILAALDSKGISSRTLVIFTSDNGGEWLSRNAPFFHRKDTVWEGGIRVPAILRWPSRLPAGQTMSQVGITMDLTATIAALAGVSTADQQYEGIDLLPILRGTTKPVERTLFWRVITNTSQQRAVRSGDWKLMLDGSLQLLFDVGRDAGERDDLAARHPDRVQKLKAQLEAWEKDVDAEAGKVSPVPKAGGSNAPHQLRISHVPESAPATVRPARAAPPEG
jgi:arylsulfatase A-like enzyme